MLLELHVKNLALIEQVDVEFAEGLNILTGETGAGKSILMGSVNLALGQKVSREMIRKGAEFAFVELVFFVTPKKQSQLESLDIPVEEDGLVVVSRKITSTRSISKINDQTVTTSKLKEVTGLLLDIHGQHEHQSLLYSSKHLEILDSYAKPLISELKESLASTYKLYQEVNAKLKEATIDQETRKREIDFLCFEIEEIESAQVKEGEEEGLADQLRLLTNQHKIMESLSVAYDAFELDGISKVLRFMNEVAHMDPELEKIKDQCYDIESVITDTRHEISSYMDNITFDDFLRIDTEERLDLIRNIQLKYGDTVSKIEHALQEKKDRLEQLENFDTYRNQLEQQLMQVTNQLEQESETLSKIRKEEAVALATNIKEALLDLNFLDVSFEMEFRKLGHYTKEGFDETEFMISTNPGEPVRSLGSVASGGELSRVMLAIKTVLAHNDEIGTLIFDEIDTGISGRTAQKVSEKLSIIAKSHQVICITHLPQIAAMADQHFEIAKSTIEGKTITKIQSLAEKDSIIELARLLGGVEITDAVFENAQEMKRLAKTKK